MQIRCWVSACDPKLFDFWIILNTFHIKYHPLNKQINYSSLDLRLGSTKGLNQSLTNCQRRQNVAGVEYPRFWHVQPCTGHGSTPSAPAWAPCSVQYMISLIWGGGYIAIHWVLCTYIYAHVCTYTFPHVSPSPETLHLLYPSSSSLKHGLLFSAWYSCGTASLNAHSHHVWAFGYKHHLRGRFSQKQAEVLHLQSQWGPPGSYTSKSTPPGSWDNGTSSCLINKWTKTLGKSCWFAEFLIPK